MKVRLINVKVENSLDIKKFEDDLWKKCSTICSGKNWSYTSYSRKLLVLVLFVVLMALYIYTTTLNKSTVYNLNEIESKSIKFLVYE